MSPLDPPVPPAGEEIHLPEGSLQPVLTAFFTTVLLVGLITFWPLSVAAGVGLVLTIARWIKDARQELEELPAEHAH